MPYMVKVLFCLVMSLPEGLAADASHCLAFVARIGDRALLWRRIRLPTFGPSSARRTFFSRTGSKGSFLYVGCSVSLFGPCGNGC